MAIYLVALFAFFVSHILLCRRSTQCSFWTRCQVRWSTSKQDKLGWVSSFIPCKINSFVPCKINEKDQKSLLLLLSVITKIVAIYDPQQTIRCRPTACSPWPSRWTAPPTPVRARARRRRRRPPPSLQWRNCTTCIMIQWLSIWDVFVPEL